MATTNYHTVNGEIIGETTGASRTGYLTDGLGSVTATQGSTGNVLATYRYKPYGALLAKTGVGTDPRFLWVGSLGYRSTSGGLPPYVRMRHKLLLSAAWTSLDPLWPLQPSFIYANDNPISLTDPSGMLSIRPTTPCFVPGLGNLSLWIHAEQGGDISCVKFELPSGRVYRNHVGIIMQKISRESWRNMCTTHKWEYSHRVFFEVWLVIYDGMGKPHLYPSKLPVPRSLPAEITSAHDVWIQKPDSQSTPSASMRGERGRYKSIGELRYSKSPPANGEWFAGFRPGNRGGVIESAALYSAKGPEAEKTWAKMPTTGSAKQSLEVTYNCCCQKPNATSCPWTRKRVPDAEHVAIQKDCPCTPQGGGSSH